MTTAAAWMPSWRRSPSRPLATSITRRPRGRSRTSRAARRRRRTRRRDPRCRRGRPAGGVPAHDERRHRLGDPVADDVGVPEHPGRVAHRGPGLDGREGHDLRHPVRSVALGRVADHLAPVALVEVHVDVGHLLAPRVQEPLEEQVVADRVEVDDPEAVGDAAPGRRPAAGPHPDPARRGRVGSGPTRPGSRPRTPCRR